MGSRWKSLKARAADRGKWPHKWWRPLPEALDLSPEEWKKQHDEISKAVNKLLLILVGFCFFCLLTLGAPDRWLLASDAKIMLPFANTTISFTSFLYIAPSVLIGFSFYLHIFVGYWADLSRPQSVHLTPEQIPQTPLPFVFNLPYWTAKLLSEFLLYVLVPVILAVFVWKDLPRPEASILLPLALIFTVMFFFLHMRRDIHQRGKFSSFLHWVMILVPLVLIVVFFFDGPPQRSLSLYNADLKKQNLTAINLTDAHLEGADLTGALLNRTNLKDANLEGANLEGANLDDANLKGANLSKVKHLTQQQVNAAFGNQKTKLPAEIIRPKQWPDIPIGH